MVYVGPWDFSIFPKDSGGIVQLRPSLQNPSPSFIMLDAYVHSVVVMDVHKPSWLSCY